MPSNTQKPLGLLVSRLKCHNSRTCLAICSPFSRIVSDFDWPAKTFLKRIYYYGRFMFSRLTFPWN
jgi:hypothetical protein